MLAKTFGILKKGIVPLGLPSPTIKIGKGFVGGGGTCLVYGQPLGSPYECISNRISGHLAEPKIYRETYDFNCSDLELSGNCCEIVAILVKWSDVSYDEKMVAIVRLYKDGVQVPLIDSITGKVVGHYEIDLPDPPPEDSYYPWVAVCIWFGSWAGNDRYEICGNGNYTVEIGEKYGRFPTVTKSFRIRNLTIPEPRHPVPRFVGTNRVLCGEASLEYKGEMNVGVLYETKGREVVVEAEIVNVGEKGYVGLNIYLDKERGRFKTRFLKKGERLNHKYTFTSRGRETIFVDAWYWDPSKRHWEFEAGWNVFLYETSKAKLKSGSLYSGSIGKIPRDKEVLLGKGDIIICKAEVETKDILESFIVVVYDELNNEEIKRWREFTEYLWRTYKYGTSFILDKNRNIKIQLRVLTPEGEKVYDEIG